MTILRYRVPNRGRSPAKVSIAWSIENPVVTSTPAQRDPAIRASTTRTKAPASPGS